MLIKKKSISSPSFSFVNKMERIIWNVVWLFFFRFSPIFLKKWRLFLIKIFGANVENDLNIYPSCKIWLPRNLTVGFESTLGPGVNIYNQGEIKIGSKVILSQGAYLCASTHDYNDPLHPLLLRPITICDNVWVCSEAFIGPGVNLAIGSVVGARSVILKDSQPWSVYSGNPAFKVKERVSFGE
jgi:putative colanic acid biosynthesis acetyltransferase WcaF